MLMTSNFEGWPLTLIEAMQFGCIPIAFDSFESLNDIITDGFNGYTIPSFNIKAMANKVQEIIICNTFDMLSTNALESVAYLTPKEIGNMWINILSNKSK